ncbi:MAG: protein phosphatase 2C domain-containing protein [Armatimonadota bacterium]|nr:protein phosphatase 2C domain-containing protein [Armatimonadota bacterium]
MPGRKNRQSASRKAPDRSPTCAIGTDPGPRSVNQDYCAYAVVDGGDGGPGSGSIFVLADGMGGHGGGDLASRVTVEKTIDAYNRANGGLSLTQRLAASIAFANSQVLSLAGTSEGTDDMGSTVVACAIGRDRMAVAHVGDSRAYLLRDGAFRQLTNDHLYVTDVLMHSQKEAERHPLKHVLSRCVGREDAEPDLQEVSCLPGDRLLLCSDGVSNVVTDREMRASLTSKTPEEAVRMLMDSAKRRARDNVTAMVIDIPDGREHQRTARVRRGITMAALVAPFALLSVLALVVVGLKGRETLQAPNSRAIQVENGYGKPVKIVNAAGGPHLLDPGKRRMLELSRDSWVVYYRKGQAEYWRALDNGKTLLDPKKENQCVVIDIKP